MEDAIAKGIEVNGERIYKRWTNQTRRYGKPGDLFPVRFPTFEMIDIFRAMLDEVVENHLKEGFGTKEEFIRYWKNSIQEKDLTPRSRGYMNLNLTRM